MDILDKNMYNYFSKSHLHKIGIFNPRYENNHVYFYHRFYLLCGYDAHYIHKPIDNPKYSSFSNIDFIYNNF